MPEEALTEENRIDAILAAHEQMVDVVGDFLTELQSGMSSYQIEKFVMNDVEFPTADAKYAQCLRELWTRYQALHDARKEWGVTRAKVRMWKAKAARLERDAAATDDELLAEELRAKADMARARLDAALLMLPMIERGAVETLREMGTFYSIYEEAKRGRRFETLEEAQKSIWMARCAMRLKYHSNQGIPPYTGLDRMELDQIAQMVKEGAPDDALLQKATGALVKLIASPEVFEFGGRKKS